MKLRKITSLIIFRCLRCEADHIVGKGVQLFLFQDFKLSCCAADKSSDSPFTASPFFCHLDGTYHTVKRWRTKSISLVWRRGYADPALRMTPTSQKTSIFAGSLSRDLVCEMTVDIIHCFFSEISSLVYLWNLPGLTTMIEDEDHAMTWYDHSDSYSPWYGHAKIMTWPSWKIARSCQGDHGHYYNVVGMLIIQPTLLIINQVVVLYFLMWNMLDEPIWNYPKAL